MAFMKNSLMLKMKLNGYLNQTSIVLNEPENQRISKSITSHHRPFVDVLSISSISRPQYAATQNKTWASHSAVRNFITVTENDDPDPLCYSNFNLEEAQSYAMKCKKKRGSENTWPEKNTFTDLFTTQFARPEWLAKKSNAGAWLCAQRRVAAGLAKLGKLYRSKKMEEIPDFLIVSDDDMYLNMHLFEQQILLQQNDTKGEIKEDGADHSAKVYAGCLVVSAPAQIHQFTFPYGGWGTFFSRGAIERLIMPLYCNGNSGKGVSPLEYFEKGACHMLTDGNDFLSESNFFEDGMSISDLMGAFASEKTPYCLHSDWGMGYFVNLYNISDVRWNGPEAHIGWYPDSEKRNRIHPLGPQNSFIYRKPDGNCLLNGATCNNKSLVCHYINNTQMERLWEEGRQ